MLEKPFCLMCKIKDCYTNRVRYSPTFKSYLCDSCFTEANDTREDKIVTSCYPVNE